MTYLALNLQFGLNETGLVPVTLSQRPLLALHMYSPFNFCKKKKKKLLLKADQESAVNVSRSLPLFELREIVDYSDFKKLFLC